MSGIPATAGDGGASVVELREHRAWYDSLPACSAQTRLEARTVPPADLQPLIDGKQRVTFAGHLEPGTSMAIGTSQAILIGDPESGCIAVDASSWQLVLCTGKRFDLLRAAEGPRGPRYGSLCTRRVLAANPSNIIVSGRIASAGSIVDAKLCRP